jgi:3-oxoacyl-[acyl-carrier-protein] synthase II
MQSDPVALIETSKTYLDRASALTLGASVLARKEAGWTGQDGPSPDRCGISLGTAYGCPDSMLRFWQSVAQKGPRLANPLFFSHSYPNTPASLEAIEHALAGPHFTFCQGLASGALALIEAADALRSGRADRMLAGGFDAVAPVDSGAAATSGPAANVVAPGEAAVFPADWRPVPAEGAAILALQRKHASDTDGPLLGKLVGSGATSFLSSPVAPATGTEPGWALPAFDSMRCAVEACMSRALSSTGRTPAEVDMIVLSASGIPALDAAEARAVHNVFGGPVGGPACTALTSRLGAAPGAAAGAAVMAATIAFREEWVVEVGGLASSPAATMLNLALEPIERAVSLALVNCIDPCGSCVSLLVAGP